MMLALKLFLVPVFLALVSLAGKRWGSAIAGWLAGFPIVAGPILLLLALEKGKVFAADAAVVALSAVFASVAFSLAYSWTCLRNGWALSLPVALLAWLLAGIGLMQLPSSIIISLCIALFTLVCAPLLFPRLSMPPAANSLPGHELLFRMVAGVLLTLAVTSFSSVIGASWSGLLAVFPILGIVLAVFSHRANGPLFVVSLLKAMASGLYSFVTFCLTLVLLLPSRGIAASFVVSTACAAVIQWAVKKR